MANEKYVLVTGASTGIGADACRYLAAKGYQVLAAVRKPEDGERVKALNPSHIQWLQMDITSQEQIEAAVQKVAALVQNKGLHALVNNAGIAVAGPVEFLPLENWRWQMEVNVIGQVAVTQAFMPLLRLAQGSRVVFVGSVSGVLSSPMVGAYSASKFAIEAVADALRRETRKQGLQVAVVQPGVISTPIWEKSLGMAEEMEKNLPKQAWDYYADQIAATKGLAKDGPVKGSPVEKTSRAIYSAVHCPTIKTRYLVGTDARIGARLAWLLPRKWMDAVLAMRPSV